MSQLPILAFIPEIKFFFPEENDAAERVHCHKPVLPAWSLGAGGELPEHSALLRKRLRV